MSLLVTVADFVVSKELCRSSAFGCGAESAVNGEC